MKTTNRKLSLLAYGLCLAAVLYNCKSKEVDPPGSGVYTFPALDKVKMPDQKVSTPAAVSVTAATVTSSTMAAAVSAGLKNIAATGQVPSVVLDASANVGKAIPADKAAAIIAAFTPDVINNLVSKGEMPASLKADVSAAAANSSLQGYMPAYTLPKVNGKPVGGRIGATVAAALSPNSVTDLDACKKAANDAYTAAVAGYDGVKATQIAAVNTAYTQNEVAANAEVAGCQSGIPAKYNALIATAKSDFDAVIAALAASRSVLGEQVYAQQLVLAYVTFGQIVTVYNTLIVAETSACTLTKDAKISAAQAARDGDLSTINANYTATVSAAAKARDQEIASCHNQGNGG